jgi:hypothetical protein
MILPACRSWTGDFSTSVARQVFHQLFRSTGRFGDSIARHLSLWPGIPVAVGTIDLQAAKQMPFMRRKLLARSGFLSAASTKELLEISNLDRIFSAADRRSKLLLKIAFFGRLPGVVGGISALSLEIQIFSWKFKSIARNPQKSGNFSARARSFKSSAELLNFQPEIRKFGWSFDFLGKVLIFRLTTSFSAGRSGFSAKHCDFPAEVFFFRWTFQFSAGDLIFRAEIQIFRRRGCPPASDLNFQRKF